MGTEALQPPNDGDSGEMSPQTIAELLAQWKKTQAQPAEDPFGRLQRLMNTGEVSDELHKDETSSSMPDRIPKLHIHPFEGVTNAFGEFHERLKGLEPEVTLSGNTVEQRLEATIERETTGTRHIKNIFVEKIDRPRGEDLVEKKTMISPDYDPNGNLLRVRLINGDQGLRVLSPDLPPEKIRDAALEVTGILHELTALIS